MAEVKARLIEELRQRTEERVNHWNQLGDWCRQRPGRFIRVDWRASGPANNSNSSSAEDTSIIGIGSADSIGSSSAFQEFANAGNNDKNTDSDSVVVKYSIVEQPD